MQVYEDKKRRGLTNRIKHATTGAMLALAAAWILSAPAQAASVSFFLDQSNRLPDGTNYLKVTVDDEGAAGAINFKIESLAPLSDLSCYKFGIDKFGFNGPELNKSNIFGLPDGWRFKNDKKMDGFGKYENVLIGKKWDRADPLSFSIVGIDGDGIGDYVASHDGGDGLFFSAHVGGLSWHDKKGRCHSCGQSAYFGDGMNNGPTPVPVPGAAWLFGSGLIGLLRLAFRRNGKAR